MLPLRLLRVIINDNGIEYDSAVKDFDNINHIRTFNLMNAQYKNYIDEIMDVGGYGYAESDPNGRTSTFSIKNIPEKLCDKINSRR